MEEADGAVKRAQVAGEQKERSQQSATTEQITNMPGQAAAYGATRARGCLDGAYDHTAQKSTAATANNVRCRLRGSAERNDAQG